MAKKNSFNAQLRSTLATAIKRALIDLQTSTESEKEFIINTCITSDMPLNDALIAGLLDHKIFIDLLQYTKDLLVASNLHTNDFERMSLIINSVLKNIRLSFVPKLQLANIGHELSIYSNRANILLVVDDSLQQYAFSRAVTRITDICFYLALYVSTYLVSFKDKPLYRFYEHNNHVQATYSSYTFEDIITQKALTTEAIYKLFIGSYQSAFSKFMIRDIPNEFIVQDNGSLYLTKVQNIQLPFIKKFEEYFDEDKVLPLFDNRKYATPNKGVVFTFKDKNSLIEKILMKEDNTQLLFKFYFKYTDDLMFVKSKAAEENLKNELMRFKLIKQGIVQHIPKKDFVLCTQVDKNSLKKATTAHDQLLTFNLINTSIYENDTCATFLYSLNFTALYCAYIAYTNPYKYKHIVQLSAVGSHSSTHTGHYSAGFVRRLPKGQKASAQALQNAKEADCFVPVGWTYVQEFNKHLRKIKHIDIF